MSGPLPDENTLAAFDYAMTNGCDGFEFDVRHSRDQRSVLCHDATLEKLEVAANHYTDLRSRRAGLCCLEDVLARFGGTAYLDIELKVSGNEADVVSSLQAHPPQRGYIVSSFLPEVLLRLHEIDPNVPLGYICDRAEAAHLWTELPVTVFLPHYSLIAQRLVDEVHAHKMQVMTWTVNRRQVLLRLAGWGVDGIIADDPTLLARTFATLPSPSAKP